LDKEERARYGKVGESLGYFLKRYPKASALLHGEAEAPQAVRFSNGNNRKVGIAKRSLIWIRQHFCPFSIVGQ
jgi:hypothetical protein